MRVLVCGSRNWANIELIRETLVKECLDDKEFGPHDCTVIDGCAHGADALGYTCAMELGCNTHRFPADWNKYGKAAGMIRNKQMLVEGKPDLVLAFWDGVSRGTKNMIELAQKAGVPVKIVKEV
jgi:hypothetical protein